MKVLFSSTLYALIIILKFAVIKNYLCYIFLVSTNKLLLFTEGTRINYQLNSQFPFSNYFVMSALSGEIITKKEIDRELMPDVELEV